MKTYTVIGIYADNHQRWAESFQAEDVEHAEEQAQDSARAQDCELIIAGVCLGEVRMIG